MFRHVTTRGDGHSCAPTIEPLENRRLFDGIPMPTADPHTTAALPPPQYDQPIGPAAPAGWDFDYSVPHLRDAHYVEWVGRYQAEFGLCPFTDPLPLGPPTPLEFDPPAPEFKAEGGGGESAPAKEMTGRKG